MAAALRRPVVWTRTADVHRPFRAQVDGSEWVLRLGDFPAEPLYTLVVDCSEVGSFDDWPNTWERSS